MAPHEAAHGDLHQGRAARRLKVAIALAAVYVIWGSTYLAIRFAVETIPPMTMAGVRFLISGALLYGWGRLAGGERPLAVHWRSAAVIGVLLLLAGNGIVVWAEQWVDSGLTALLVSTTPLWMVLLHWRRQGGSRPGLPVWLGIALGLAGVGLLVSPGDGSAGGVSLGGAALLVCASFAWAVGSLYSRRAPLPASPLVSTGMEMLAGGALLLAFGLAIGEGGRLHPAAISTASLLGFGYLVVFGSLGFLAYLWVLKAAPPALVSTYSYVNPLVAVLLGWALAGERLTGRTMIAAAVIVSGVALITLSTNRRPEKAREAGEVRVRKAVPEAMRIEESEEEALAS